MKRYHYPLFMFRRFHTPCLDSKISWHNGAATYHVRNGRSVVLRQYSSGFAGVNRVPENFDDIDTVGAGKVNPTISDFHQQGYSQNFGQFQHQSSPRNHYANDWTRQQNFGNHSMANVGSNDPSRGNNKVAGNPGGYQQEVSGSPLSSNAFHQANPGGHLGNSSGFYNGHSGPHHQNFIGSHNAQVLTESPLSTPYNGVSANDVGKNVEGMLEEFDTYCKEWDLENAVNSMRMMGEKRVHIDLPRYLILIKACGEAKASKEAKVVHEHLIKFMSPITVSTFNQILEMYGKCGLMEDAYSTFNQMPERNLTSWDTMISWYARNGLGEEAIDVFTRFKESGLKPDGQMFFGVFDACAVLGDVAEGMLHFESMSKTYGIVPSMAHYASIVQMFGSAGYLDGALEFIESMPVEPSIEVWESLMNISRVQGNIELGDRCAQIVEQLDPSRMSKDSKAGLLPVKDSDSLKKKVKKASPLEHTKHEYRAGDRSHPENDKIYAILRGMKESMKEAGYIPETRFVLHDIDPEGKEEAIMAHSERLACTYALITSAARMPIRIIKNLRVCGDCHNAFKIISKLVGREVIMRDAKRFHHFKDGKCSCNDYW